MNRNSQNCWNLYQVSKNGLRKASVPCPSFSAVRFRPRTTVPVPRLLICMQNDITMMDISYFIYDQRRDRIYRLNSEDFSKFFPCWDILFLTYSYESTHREVQKNAKIFSIILEYSWFFRLFRGFSYKTFLSSELQSRVNHHKIPRKILHRTVIVRSRGSTGEK